MKLGFKIWVLIIMFVVSLIFIFGIPPQFLEKGVIVTGIESHNNSLFDQGMKVNDIIISVDGNKIETVDQFNLAVIDKFPSESPRKLEIQTKNGDYLIFTKVLPEFTVAKIPKTNLKLGLDLAGGARALVKAQNRTLSKDDINDLVSITQNRLNAFGLTDLKVSPVSDLSGNNFMLIEIAGATPKDLHKIISEQGEFKAMIGNVTAFEGGARDIASVGRDAQNARIESCAPSSDGYLCRFSFTITLSPAAAQRHADITDGLEVNRTAQGAYLSKPLDLILDGNQVDSLLIGEGLKGRVTTQISISGSGSAATRDEAYDEAKAQMKKLQTILMTGSLPYKLEIVKLDTVSPTLGDEFTSSIFLASGVAILLVSLIIFIRYRNWKSSLALIITTVSEIVIILGIAALIDWNIDLPGIAGILATFGTGVDDLIVILDESRTAVSITLKERFKRAFAIIMGSYFTTLVSLMPLMWAGAGLLKGFAITTIIGISVGVFITRPAFSELIRKWNK